MGNLQSILLYLVVFIFSYALMRFGIQSKMRILVFASLMLVVVLGFIRYGLGIDYASYLELYGFHGEGVELNTEVSYHAALIEPMFVWLAQLSFTLTGTPLLYLGVPWAATVVLVYLGLRKFLADKTPEQIALAWLTILPIMTALGFNQIRQTLAAALLFFAFQYLLSPRFINIVKYLFFATLASLSHFSAIFIAILLLLVSTVRGNSDDVFSKRTFSVTMISAISISVLVVLSASVKDLLLTQFSDVKYIREFYRLLFMDSDASGLIFGIVSIRPENIIVLLIFLIPTILFFQGKYVGDRRVIVACVVGLIIATLSLFVLNGERLAQYFIFFAPVAMAGIVGTKYNMKAIYAAVIFGIVMLFGWQGVTHYNTIFNRDVDLNIMAQRRIRSLNSQIGCYANPGRCEDVNLYELDVSRSWLQYGSDDLWRLR